MILKSLKTHFINSLLEYYPESEISSFFYMLTEHFLGMSRIDIALNNTITISDINKDKFQNSIDRLKKIEPIQYIIGETEFFSLPFRVNSSVLIPRPETEELVNWIIDNIKIQNTKPTTILDVGTGSGCIAVTLAKNCPNCNVFGLDVSKEALTLAKENAILNNVGVEFFEADILNCNLRFDDLECDIIVSNPPYVRALEKNEMSPNVLDFEPHLALFVEDEDSLLFYRKITQLASKILKTKGQLFFEINEYLGNEMIKLLESEGFIEVELKTDIFSKDRMIKGVKS